MRIPMMIASLGLCFVCLGGACGKDASNNSNAASSPTAPNTPPTGQVLRDAEAQVRGQVGTANIDVRDFKVDGVELDPYEKDLATATVSYRANNFHGGLRLSYRNSADFWKLEKAVDLGLK